MGWLISGGIILLGLASGVTQILYGGNGAMMIFLIWAVAAAIWVKLYMNKYEKKNKAAKESQIEENNSYVKHLPDDYQFSDNVVELLDGMEYICKEIARSSTHLRYLVQLEGSFQYGYFLTLNVATGVAKGRFCIQPGGSWDNDFNILDSLSGKKVETIIRHSFTDIGDGHAFTYLSNNIRDVDRQWCIGQNSEWMMRSRMEQMVNAWCSEFPEGKCVVKEMQIFDNREQLGEIGIHVEYTYSVNR